MAETYSCWIDGSICHAKGGPTSLEACKLCQRTRLIAKCLRKGLEPNVVIE